MDQRIVDSFNMLQENADEPNWLPPGFRFYPTDDELIDYLKTKASNPNFRVRAIQQVDLKKSEPWELPGKSKMGEKEWYFFTLRDRKYPTGMRTNRATEAGYWKGTGKDREVISARSNAFVGMKKTLVFYKGRAPKGEKTNWIMHEYRLEGARASLHAQNSRISQDSEWVVCRIFHKMPGGRRTVIKHFLKANHCNMQQNQLSDQLFLPPLHEWPIPSLATDDPEFDSDDHSGLQATSFPAEHTALPLCAIAENWIEGAKSSDSAMPPAFLETTSSSTFGFTAEALPYTTPYLDYIQPLFSNAHAPRIIKREQVLPSSALTNFTEENERFQGGGQKILADSNDICVEREVDYECSNQPLLNLSCIPVESPLLDISDEISSIIYKNGLLSPEDLSCFW